MRRWISDHLYEKKQAIIVHSTYGALHKRFIKLLMISHTLGARRTLAADFFGGLTHNLSSPSGSRPLEGQTPRWTFLLPP